MIVHVAIGTGFLWAALLTEERFDELPSWIHRATFLLVAVMLFGDVVFST